jgi:hypothetical protein
VDAWQDPDCSSSSLVLRLGAAAATIYLSSIYQKITEIIIGSVGQSSYIVLGPATVRVLKFWKMKDEKKQKIGGPLRSAFYEALGEIGNGCDLQKFAVRVKFFGRVEEILNGFDWLTMADGTLYEKKLTPPQETANGPRKVCFSCDNHVFPDGDFCPVCGDVFLKYVV